SYLVLGWSSGVGTDWNSVANQLYGATLQCGQWFGGRFATNSNPGWLFLGASMIAYGAAGGMDSGGNSIPSLQLFGTGPTGAGVPISQGWDMYVVTAGVCPEPSALALAGLAAALAIIFYKKR